MKKLLLALVVMTVFLSSSAFAADIGVVFLHPKWGTTNPKSPIGPLIAAMEKAGYLVEFPEMPWSRERAYDRDVDGAMSEIDAAVKRLKDKGAKRIVVGGQSMGANAAMIYGARRDGLAGVMAVSPGHTPEIAGYRSSLKGDVERAQKLIADGKGDARDYFYDNNQGKEQKLPSTAKIYLSWFDPNGAAVFPKSAAELKPGTALLWIVGDDDPMAKRGEGYAYAQAPANPKSAYKVVGGGHFDAGGKAASEIIAWLGVL